MSIKIVISPFSRKLRNGKENPKNYPIYKWKWLVSEFEKRGYEVIQVGVKGEEKIADLFLENQSLEDLKELILDCDVWLSVDNFFQHLAWTVEKSGIVLFSLSNPDIFGHKENINLCRDKSYFRLDQFGKWEDANYSPGSFVSKETVLKTVNGVLSKKILGVMENKS
jgi:ADP-heptose:LPS heptosyltransferase